MVENGVTKRRADMTESLTTLEHQSKINSSQTVLVLWKKSHTLLPAITAVNVLTSIAMCQCCASHEIKM